MKANIKAAPQMYEALEEILQSMEYAHRAHPEITGRMKAAEDIWRANAALKAARGEQ